MTLVAQQRPRSHRRVPLTVSSDHLENRSEQSVLDVIQEQPSLRRGKIAHRASEAVETGKHKAD